MTLGIVPSAPSTAYGYIEPGETLGDRRGQRLKRFVEKPDAATAQSYLDKGFLWNSGNFVFSAAAMLRELAAFAPEIVSAARGAIAEAQTDLDFVRLDPKTFAGATKISIDYAVMEKTQHASVIAATFDWSDIGAWDSIYDVMDKGSAGNVLQGPVVALDAANSLLRSDDMLLTTISLSDVVVVATRDAVLVASKDAAGKVKTLVEQLKQEGRPEATEHLRIYRPWGWYQRIDIGGRFQVKRIRAEPDLSESLGIPKSGGK